MPDVPPPDSLTCGCHLCHPDEPRMAGRNTCPRYCRRCWSSFCCHARTGRGLMSRLPADRVDQGTGHPRPRVHDRRPQGRCHPLAGRREGCWCVRSFRARVAVADRVLRQLQAVQAAGGFVQLMDQARECVDAAALLRARTARCRNEQRPLVRCAASSCRRVAETVLPAPETPANPCCRTAYLTTGAAVWLSVAWMKAATLS